MVAYSFQQQFEEPILAGTKRQTIRRPRKRHARLGEELQLFYAMRTKQCRLIGRARCSAIIEVRLHFPACRNMGGSKVEMRDPDFGTWEETRMAKRLDDFARKDGFDDWGELHEFWALNHPDVRTFEGVMIQWEGFQRAD